MKLRQLAAWVVLATGLSSANAFAQADDLQGELVLGAAVINILDTAKSHNMVAAVEYRFGEFKWNLRPWVGIAYAESDTYYASAGLALTVPFESGLEFTLGFAPSYYHQGNGKDLGYDLEFYSFAEIGWKFENDHAVKLRVGHLSNAGFGNKNPGTEVVQLGYSLPIFGK